MIPGLREKKATMSEPAFQRVEELFHEAVEVDPGRRAAFLDTKCGGDGALRAAVQELLDHDARNDAATFLASPVARPTDGDGLAVARPGWNVGDAPPPAFPGYEILGEVGRGGMGVVYRARQTGLNRLVALKMLLPGAPGGLERLVRFRTEAEVLARLNHPNIVPIYDIGECEGRPYFTMEYVPGRDLARFLDGRPQDAAASARLVETLARAVDAAHRCGVIHRDLKPANVLLHKDEGGRMKDVSEATSPSSSSFILHPSSFIPKITDFGLAKDMTTSAGLTRTGEAMGTPCYMAPEQARGDRKAVGPATDIYSLGVILYEMLTGRPPFDAASPAETVAQVLHDDPVPPSRLRPRLPRDLVTICMKCLDKAPGRRYGAALDLAEDLRRFQAGEPIHARPVGVIERAYRWGRRRPLVAALLGLLGVLIVAFIVTVVVYEVRLRQKLTREEAIDAEQRRQIVRLDITIGVARRDEGDAFTALLYFTDALRLDDALPELARDDRIRIDATLRQCPRLIQLRTFDDPVICATLGPAGGRAAVIGADNGIQVRDLATGEAVGPTLPMAVATLDGAFGPDGRSLALIGRDGKVYIWDLETGKDRELEGEAARRAAPHPGERRAVFSPDGEHCVVAGPDGFAEVRRARTDELVAPPLRQGGPMKAAAFSADGKQVVVVGGAGVVCVWELPDGPATRVADGAAEPDPRPTEELTTLAQILADACLDENMERQTLDAPGLQDAWDRLPHGR